MNKICMFLLAAMMLVSLLGCDASQPIPPQDNLTFSYHGTQIMLNSEVGPVIDALGEPKSYTEEPSCAFDGVDKTYYFGSFYLSTYPLEGTDYVYRIWFVDDSVATVEGIRIGTSQAEVEAIYGADSFHGTNTYTQVKGDSRLTILLTDGLVSSIQYDAIID